MGDLGGQHHPSLLSPNGGPIGVDVVSFACGMVWPGRALGSEQTALLTLQLKAVPQLSKIACVVDSCNRINDDKRTF